MIKRNARRGGIRGVEVLLFLVVVGLLGGAALMQQARLSKLQFKQELFRQRIKLPPVEAMRFFTMGYDNMYANWLWLQSIQAFGSGWITEDGTTKPIYQYFDTMTDLDPHFIPSYRFGNLIIGDNRFDWVRGQQLLEKGCHKNPMNYDLPYLGLYNAIFQTNDLQNGRWFAARLRRIPEAPSFMRRMEEYIERQDGRFEAAFEMNVRYYLEYIINNNTIEREIVERRMLDVVDRLAVRKLTDAAWAYAAANDGKHPWRTEDLIDPKFLPPFETPYLPAFVASVERNAEAIELLDVEKPIPDDLVASVVKESTITVSGLPPEPRGTWYMISPFPRYEFEKVNWHEGMKTGGELPYILPAYSHMQDFNHLALEAQSRIMAFVDGNDGKRPTDEQVASFLGRDRLGGYLTYQREAPESPKYGVYFSTAIRRISEGKDPRMGARGAGPFPLPLTPSIFDFPEDYRWGLENGYVAGDGTELLYLAPNEPNWEERREAYMQSIKPKVEDSEEESESE